jgi:hypothetical protein
MSFACLAFAFVLAATQLAGQPAPKQDGGARDLVKTAVTRMGGEAALRSLETMRIETVGYRNLLEQSERPEGPWIPQIERTVELWDTRGEHERWQETTEATTADDTSTLKTIVAGGAAARKYGDRWLPTSRGAILEAREWMALSPQQVLLAALAAGDLRRDPDLEFQGVPHHSVSFGAGEDRRRILLSAQTGFLTAVETMRAYPDDLFWQIWGDVPTRVSYSYWDLRPGGLLYPLQWDVERGGRPWRALTIAKLEPAAAFASDDFAIPQSEKDAFAARGAQALDELPLGTPSKPAVELAPGVVLIPGSWGVALVRQSDGVVVLEAPISAGYSARVLDEAKRRFPGLPVKAVVTTSDSWPHFGGIREYVARGIPVYLLDLNVPQIRRALESPHRFHPDALAKNPREAILRPVSSRTVIGDGDGPNRIELYPSRGETGERMMLAFLPDSGVLYASDLYQSGRGGPPEYAWEVAEVARREKLNVKTVFAMHSDPAPWQALLDVVSKAIQGP